MKLVEAAILLVVMIPAARGLWLNLPSSGTKCVSEELHSNVFVLGDYHSFFGEQDDSNNTVAPIVSVKVRLQFFSIVD